MTLTPEQRAELEALGPELVRQKYLLHGDVEDWLVEKHREDLLVQRTTLRWARIAAWAGIAGVGIGIVAIVIAIWLAK